ncbi:unnamed protein product, partial [Phaeothamnion confervicola]
QLGNDAVAGGGVFRGRGLGDDAHGGRRQQRGGRRRRQHPPPCGGAGGAALGATRTCASGVAFSIMGRRPPLLPHMECHGSGRRPQIPPPQPPLPPPPPSSLLQALLSKSWTSTSTAWLAPEGAARVGRAAAAAGAS